MSQPGHAELFELDSGERENEQNEDSSVSVPSLPPVDGGRAAWLFLTAAFMTETLLWGFPFSFGVLQTYYRTHPPISENPEGISAVATTCTGIMYLAAPIMTLIIQQGPFFRKYGTFIGLALVVLGTTLSSFATTVWQLILTQGILYAVGGGLLYYPVLLFIDEWFLRRRSIAYGVMWAGSGVGGLTAPLILDWGLSNYGVRTFLRGWAVTLLVLIGPLLFFAKARVPWSGPSRGRLRSFTTGFGFVKTRTFWLLQAGNIMQGLGYFIPLLYLPDYAKSLGLGPLQQSAIVSILNTAAVPGVIVLAILCDHLHVTSVIFISALGSAVATFLFWGLSSPSTSLPLLATFAAVYGFFAGGFTSSYSAMLVELRRAAPEGAADLGSMVGLLSMGRGIGNVVSGPLSEALLGDRIKPSMGIAYVSGYSPLVMFTGLTAVLTLTPWVTRRLRLI